MLLRAAKLNKVTMTRPILRPYHENDDDREIEIEKEPCLRDTEDTNNGHVEYLEDSNNNNIINTINNSNNNSEQKKNIDFRTKFRLKGLCRKDKAHKKHIKIQYSALELVKNMRLLSFLVICVSFG